MTILENYLRAPCNAAVDVALLRVHDADPDAYHERHTPPDRAFRPDEAHKKCRLCRLNAAVTSIALELQGDDDDPTD